MIAERRPPIACALQPSALNDRQQRIANLARRSLLSHHRQGLALTVRYERSAAAELREIVMLEQECCEFLRFGMQEVDGLVELRISAPPDAGAAADQLF